MILREYQRDIFEKIKGVIAAGGSPLSQLETGAGKTPIIAALCGFFENTIVVTHRNELAVQASEKLAALGLTHDLVGTKSTRQRAMLRHHVNGHGRGLISASSNRFVASIQSIISWCESGKFEFDSSKKWIILIDEAHHALTENMWGQLVSIFKNRQVIGFTGTPARLDGGSLHEQNGGLFSCLLQADSLKENSTRTLMESGYLSDYIAFAPQNPEKLGSYGEQHFMKKEVAGNVVTAYKQHAKGSKAICLCVSIAHAKSQAREFVGAGIPSLAIASDMGQSAINRVLDLFSTGHIRVMCAVDMVSEGFDCPDAETLICTNFTQSFVRYRQWMGRVLRPAEGKVARVIDMCGLIHEHGMPDDQVVWDIINPPARTHKLRSVACHKCFAFYPLTRTECPHCGAENMALRRNSSLLTTIQERMDMALLEVVRRKVESEKIKRRLEEQIVMPNFIVCVGAIGTAVAKIRLSYAEALLESGVPPGEINQFLRSDCASREDWWIHRFTLRDLDLRSNFLKKSMREHKKWQSR